MHDKKLTSLSAPYLQGMVKWVKGFGHLTGPQPYLGILIRGLNLRLASSMSYLNHKLENAGTVLFVHPIFLMDGMQE